jgi:hypothetical protein
MIDIDLLKENYSRMTDSQLIHLVETEGHQITPDALRVLREEFSNRKLDSEVFGVVETNHNIKKHQSIETFQENAEVDFAETIWKYVFDEKIDGKSNNDILNGLSERGIGETDRLAIIGEIESKAEVMFSKYDKDSFNGGAICLIGILVTVVTFVFALKGGTYIIAWGAIIFGAIRYFRGLSNKKKFRTLLSNIKHEGKSASGVLDNELQGSN